MPIFGQALGILRLILILVIVLVLLQALALIIKGLDIGAPQGSNLVAVCDGKITFTGFLGGGGYTITLTSGNIKFTYCHVSPNYIVKTGDMVKKGQVIGKVGPKNVYGVKR